MKAMIFAAGLGTRLQPITQSKPKALVEIAGKTMLAHAISKLSAAGFNEIVVNVHHFSEQVISYIHQNKWPGTNIYISNESSMLLDTGGGLQKAIEILGTNENVLLHNVDIISSADINEIFQSHEKKNADATVLVSDRESSRYLYFTNDMRLNGWINIKTNDQIIVNDQLNNCQKLAFSGISVVSANFLNGLQKEGKYSLITALLEQAKISNIIGFKDSGTFWADAGSISGIMRAEQHLKNFHYE